MDTIPVRAIATITTTTRIVTWTVAITFALIVNYCRFIVLGSFSGYQFITVLLLIVVCDSDNVGDSVTGTSVRFVVLRFIAILVDTSADVHTCWCPQGLGLGVFT